MSFIVRITDFPFVPECSLEGKALHKQRGRESLYGHGKLTAAKWSLKLSSGPTKTVNLSSRFGSTLNLTGILSVSALRPMNSPTKSISKSGSAGTPRSMPSFPEKLCIQNRNKTGSRPRPRNPCPPGAILFRSRRGNRGAGERSPWRTIRSRFPCWEGRESGKPP